MKFTKFFFDQTIFESLLGLWKGKCFPYTIPAIFSMIYIIVCALSLWYVKNELESGYCDYYRGGCCTQWLIGDGICDDVNNFQSCSNYDGGDCRPPN